ncbi:hypothetical protein TNCV_4941721 [Trichonephila clavipes]|nr:hypothetical protein TNCV_4941721 [Trichonephila clavipes]
MVRLMIEKTIGIEEEPRLFVKTASIATLESQGDIQKKPVSGNAFDMQNRDPNTLNDYLQTDQYIEMRTEEHHSFTDLQTDEHPKKVHCRIQMSEK